MGQICKDRRKSFSRRTTLLLIRFKLTELSFVKTTAIEASLVTELSIFLRHPLPAVRLKNQHYEIHCDSSKILHIITVIAIIISLLFFIIIIIIIIIYNKKHSRLKFCCKKLLKEVKGGTTLWPSSYRKTGSSWLGGPSCVCSYGFDSSKIKSNVTFTRSL